MFCEKCGFENQENSKFCEKCGNELHKKEKKQFSLKKKVLLGVGILLIIAIGSLYWYGSNKYQPKQQALEFFEAIISNDTDKIYEYLYIEPSKFTSKQVFKEIYEAEEVDKLEVINYKVTNEEKSDDGLSRTVTISYILKGSEETEEIDINLVKTKDKKLLIFDDWHIQMGAVSLIENVEIYVPKGSIVTIASEQLGNAEMVENEEDNNFDIYKIAEMFDSYYPVKVKTPFNFEYETEVYFEEGENLIDYDASEVSDEVLEVLSDQILTDINYIYTSALNNKDFEEVKTYFSSKADIDVLKNEYEDLISVYKTTYYEYNKINFTEIENLDIEVSNDGYLLVSFDASFDYSINYSWSDEAYEGTNSSMFSFIYNHEDGYKLISIY